MNDSTGPVFSIKQTPKSKNAPHCPGISPRLGYEDPAPLCSWIYIDIHIYAHVSKLPALHVFDARTICCTDWQCAGPSYICIARIFMEQQFGRGSRTYMEARYLRTQLHGDARTGCGAPLARNCTETKPNKVTAWQPCHRAKHTNNTLEQRRRQFLQTLQREP